MKYLFFVQGEGRGHLAQALTLKEKLEKRGHSLLAVIIGSSDGAEPPSFFQEQIGVPLILISSPGFLVDKKGQGIRVGASIIHAIINIPRYRASYKKIKNLVADYRPDALVSFYEPLAGIYHRLSGDERPLYCLGHQYFADHPDFRFPAGRYLARRAFKAYNYLTTSRRSIRLALSFIEAPDQADQNLLVCPPLIRTVIKKQNPTKGDFILVYILNAGYSEQIIDWSRRHPGVKIEAFWNHPDEADTIISPDLTFHHLSGEKFIERLAACRAYVSTGGFDSIAEAAYLQKPILMNPTKNHFEQSCNAVDAGRAGLALAANNFDISLIIEQLDNAEVTASQQRFKAWVDGYDDKIAERLSR